MSPDEEIALWENCVAHAVARAPADPAEGLFGPESALWQVAREVALPIYGMRAVVLQIAHPAVAAAGSQHSGFKQAFLPRTIRTFSSMYAVMFGDRDMATSAARRAHRIHTLSLIHI